MPSKYTIYINMLIKRRPLKAAVQGCFLPPLRQILPMFDYEFELAAGSNFIATPFMQ